MLEALSAPRLDQTSSSALPAERIARAIETLAPPDQLVRTQIHALTLYVWRAGATRLHLVYRPSLCVVFRGSKQARVGDLTYRYGPDHFFFTSIPLPAELDARRDESGALIGLILELELSLVARVALEIDDALGRTAPRHQAEPAAAAALAGRTTPRLLQALERLLEIAFDPVRHRVLEDSALREVVFELLFSPEGPALRSAVRRRGSLRALIEVVGYIDEHCHEPLRVPALARRAKMSESAFFARFRELTGATPLQYIKRLRLTKARVLLSMGNGNVTEVAHAMGYASSAQFSREFRHAFGCAPKGVLKP